jgi:hypothetical protein
MLNIPQQGRILKPMAQFLRYAAGVRRRARPARSARATPGFNWRLILALIINMGLWGAIAAGFRLLRG